MLPTDTLVTPTVSEIADTAIPSTSSLDLGVVGNCAFNALIDKLGRVVWCCLPRFDGDPVFNALLDPSENGSLWSFQLENFSHSEQW
ncbi:MAG: glycoside hydrolase family 15 protein, partial [Glaciimonas sp.]|nr:glycoside hydrolase family 15 protein [Glaciimonas sp.]